MEKKNQKAEGRKEKNRIVITSLAKTSVHKSSQKMNENFYERMK